MARRRMYLFERAYVVFFARLRRFLNKSLVASRSIWEWFFHGLGAKIMDVVLKIAVVGSAIFMCVIYMRYESDRGRGFSGTTFFALLFIFIYAFLLLWAWKAPVHFAARLSSGAVAAGLAFVFMLVIGILAVAIFIPYFIALILLTASSLAIFIPMRIAHWMWLQQRKITYKCPYDDCRFHGMPIHVCSCGSEYADLQPSFYGIFHHVCWHNGTKIRLPTMNFLGRNKLPRLCGRCHRPLLHSSIGELREWPIFVMGGPNSGKSVYIAQAVRALMEHYSKAPGSTICLDSEMQSKEHAEQLRLLDSGQVLAKTAGDVMTALGLALRIPKGMRSLIYLFDKPGEYFQSMQQFGRMQGIEGLKGILLIVDPFSLPALSEHAESLRGQLKPSETPFTTVAGNLILVLEQILTQSQSERCNVPLAVVLSKADAFPVRTLPFLADLYSGDGGATDDARNQRCREALKKLGGEASIRMLEQKFSEVNYFACTALGRMPDLKDTAPFRPSAVAEPLQWLLAAETRAATRSRIRLSRSR